MLISKINFNTNKPSSLNCQPLTNQVAFKGEFGKNLDISCDTASTKNHLGNKLNMVI